MVDRQQAKSRARIDQGDAVGAIDILDPQQEGDIGVLHRDAVEMIAIGGKQVEERVITSPVDYHLAIAGRLDHDGLVRCAAGSEVIGAVKGRAIGLNVLIESAIDKAVVLIDPGMDQDDIVRSERAFLFHVA